MGLFSIGEKHNTNTTNLSTTNEYNDSSANAGGDNSVALGSGAAFTINTQDLSENVAIQAIKSGVDQTALASYVANNAVENATKQTQFAVNTITGLSEVAARENKDTRDSADLALRTSAGLTSQLQEQTAAALGRAQAPEATSVALILKPIIWGIGIIVVVGGLVFYTSKKPAK